MSTAFAKFTEEEKKRLYGQSEKIASKHGCSGMYVRRIVKGERNINTPLAQKIMSDLKVLLTLFKPVENDI